jgi:hypothetical protein
MVQQVQRAEQPVAREAVVAGCMAAQPPRAEQPVALEAVAAGCMVECSMAGRRQGVEQHRRVERHQKNISTDCYSG